LLVVFAIHFNPDRSPTGRERQVFVEIPGRIPGNVAKRSQRRFLACPAKACWKSIARQNLEEPSAEPCPLTEQMGGNNFCFTGFMFLMRAAGLLRKKAAGLKVRRDIHRAGGATDSHDK